MHQANAARAAATNSARPVHSETQNIHLNTIRHGGQVYTVPVVTSSMPQHTTARYVASRGVSVRSQSQLQSVTAVVTSEVVKIAPRSSSTTSAQPSVLYQVVPYGQSRIRPTYRANPPVEHSRTGTGSGIGSRTGTATTINSTSGGGSGSV